MASAIAYFMSAAFMVFGVLTIIASIKFVDKTEPNHGRKAVCVFFVSGLIAWGFAYLGGISA